MLSLLLQDTRERLAARATDLRVAIVEQMEDFMHQPPFSDHLFRELAQAQNTHHCCLAHVA